MAIGLFIPKVLLSQLLVGILHSVGFSVSYTEVLKVEKYAPVSSVKFDDFVSDSALGLENRFWQFTTDNFDHNEDTLTGTNTTHVMGTISCETPKSEFIMFQPIRREDISSSKLLKTAKFKKSAVNQVNPN